jgi:hypothetical protein
MIKTLNKLKIGRKNFNLTRGFYVKLTANILIDVRVNLFAPRPKTRQRCLLLSLLFNPVL